MAAIRTAAAETYRDRVDPEDPESALHNPEKTDIRDLLGVVEDYVEDAKSEAVDVAVDRGFRSGDICMKYSLTAPAGWINHNGYIGNASSGASLRANADTVDLFTVLWVNTDLQLKESVANGGANVSRGTSAAADFALNRRMTIPEITTSTGTSYAKFYVRL